MGCGVEAMSQTERGLQQPAESGPSDPVRRAVAILLMLYLSPVLLLVFVLGGVGVGLCTTVRWISRLAGRTQSVARMRPRVAHLVVAGQDGPMSGRG
jgi:hypothetical protein